MRIFIGAVTALFLFGFWFAPSARAQQARQVGGAQRDVRIYLTDFTIVSDTNIYSLRPVGRRVNASAPARNALIALLKGPTQAETKKNLVCIEDGELHIGSLSIHNQTARVNFVGREQWAGVMSAPRFVEAVTKTLLQFPGIKKVTVRVNGSLDIDSQK